MADTTGHLPGGAAAAPSARNLTGAWIILLLALAPQLVELLIALAGLIVQTSGRTPSQVLSAHAAALVQAIPTLARQAAGEGRTALSSDVLLAVIYTYPLLAVALFTWLVRIRAPQDYYGGIALMAIALFALWASSDLQGMRGFSFGPGTAPRMLGVLLLGLGAVVAATGVIADGADIAPYHWRGPLFVTLAILTFAVAIRPLGLVVAGLASFLISALGTSETRWGETLVVGIALTIGCALLFPYVLGLPMPLFPRFLVP
ncbi:tripartite tricarboxylate transporter TctB family protein [Bradyrhizobium sp. HKCCYLS1011]|uniref:tripartite tricarboxylate transporter TctB family protein n=1 Tax=Bradyrhizobium sp. HKCCYLS1011 TaxID=3420733 RepID=UPI003EBA65EB